ncbi:MAG: DUF2723 domain-containing protein [Chloroflexi bacterium]|nr:MAG: DUF2723 domain-containing protein [Chloroflexota bacterium]
MTDIKRSQVIFFILASLALALAFLHTLQTIPNGSSHYFMIDVGETQIVLNVWGTLHATGYPLYVITGNILTDVMTALGISPVVAPALVSMLWGYITLGLIYWLAWRITRRLTLAVGLIMVFALTRTMWIHFSIAEIYTFGLMLQVGLILLALWNTPDERRIYWLALLGGIAVAHHRATVMMIPALLYATYPAFIQNRHKLPRILVISLLLGVIGFSQYAYLYLRAQAGADWVYGEPGTLNGLWTEFIGKEASRFIGPAHSWDALLANFKLVNRVLVYDLTLPGLLLGIIGLGIGIRHHRRAGITFSLIGMAAYGFHVIAYRDVLSALILLITLALAFGWLFLADALLNSRISQARYVLPMIILATVSGLFIHNREFLYDLTHDRTGIETIELLESAPQNSTVMLAWGPRYFAASIGQLFLNRLQHIQLVDHKGEHHSGILTPEYTLYNQPISWWEARLNSPVYLQAVAPFIVQINTTPTIIDDVAEGIRAASMTLTCQEDSAILDVLWQTHEAPQEDFSVFVHGLDAEGNLVGQGDQYAPVYGWRPLTTWQAGEQIRDIYVVNATDITHVRFGLYRIQTTGEFENVLTYEVICDAQQ